MKKKHVASIAALALLTAFGTAACGSSASSGSAASDTTASASAADDSSSSDSAGFEEISIGDDIEAGPLNIGAVYFQPVDMEPAGMGLSAAEASFHLEADIHALADNNLGYATGDFVPDCTVEYAIVNNETGETADSGTFMQMNASDGMHYGGNVKLTDAGSYTLKLTIHSPAENGWMLHTDSETGVTGHFWTEPLEVEWTNWDYTPVEW
ncbi:iron transporter [Pseudoscardovia radai]|uniref:iron transporter n=1 Tax=Pseudoscardovia radai TaxID=987066 RepID=UPI003996505E